MMILSRTFGIHDSINGVLKADMEDQEYSAMLFVIVFLMILCWAAVIFLLKCLGS